MGYFPIGVMETVKAIALVMVLFAGPIFEAGVVDGAWKDWIRLRGISDLFGSWLGYRNLIAGPITEEVLFRSAALPLFLLSRASLKIMVFGTPLIFGLAHFHHCYEFIITHPGAPFWQAVLQSVVQLTYTALFGSFTTFVYLRTGSLLAVIVAHMFCNWMGLPRFWGRVGATEAETIMGGEDGAGKRDSPAVPTTAVGGAGSSQQGNLIVTVVYYALLVGGAIGFYQNLWKWTESGNALVEF